nr:hypothetical protein [Tanacetum cinerariifolium]
MTALIFADSHNMVAYLKKLEANADFAKIVDFLNAGLIRYDLTERKRFFRDSYTIVSIYDGITSSGWKAKIKVIEIPLPSDPTNLDADEAIYEEKGDRDLVQVVDPSSKKPWGTELHKLAKKIVNLKKRVKRLERKRQSGTLGMKLFKIGTSRRRSLCEEDASKRGKNDFDDEGFDADMNDVFEDVKGDANQVISAATDEASTGDAVNTVGTEVNTASASVTTAGISISTAEPNTPPITTTTVIEEEDLIIAQTFVKMRSEKSNTRGVVIKEPSETTTRPTVPPQKHNPKDKGVLVAIWGEVFRPMKCFQTARVDLGRLLGAHGYGLKGVLVAIWGEVFRPMKCFQTARVDLGRLLGAHGYG